MRPTPIFLLTTVIATSLSACADVDPVRSRCLSGLWQAGGGEAFALNVREDGSLRIVGIGGRVWTLTQDGPRWRGGIGQGNGKIDTTLEDGRCAKGELRLSHPGGKIDLVSIALDQRFVRFTAAGETLAGKLIVPKRGEPAALVVLLHGGEKRSAVASNPLQYLLPAQGIAAFVFDKRGTGNSGGSYTQNFERLALDAVQALSAARTALARPEARVGFLGGSQGAWVAPLAATRGRRDARPDFVIAAYGLAQTPLEEDREEVFDDLRRKGFGDAATLAKAREITDATAAVMRANFATGLDHLDALKQKYGAERWYKAIDGEFTGDFLAMPSWLLAIIGPFLDEDTSWDYDPRPVIAGLDAPMLWVLAGKDSEAPSATTLEILRRLQTEQARPIDIAFFPDAEHAMASFRERDGERTLTGFIPGYFSLLGAWIKTGQLPAEGGILTFPKQAPSVYSLPR